MYPRWVDRSEGYARFGVGTPIDLSVAQGQWTQASSGSCAFISVGGAHSYHAGNTPGTGCGQSVGFSGNYWKAMI